MHLMIDSSSCFINYQLKFVKFSLVSFIFGKSNIFPKMQLIVNRIINIALLNIYVAMCIHLVYKQCNTEPTFSASTSLSHLLHLYWFLPESVSE